jgi:hypothetical protein
MRDIDMLSASGQFAGIANYTKRSLKAEMISL